ncbi:hypothetical protein QUF79_19100 [Fictibacillus enclensis]|uniref:Uncharacterized protein n=1 Tax=Fictibacillus enclensis TaxID=1017270 RepID=A0A0V8J9V1_9BACL|nr:hypothetical protein [Fictibacillus enclensis]KSU83608.1 hypothetical protein AS030_13765 [Fictibacillus enclensis]MDM5200123.1 hypothetical protein [Fictibacillus enclensis]WHY70885.1 hypothetical protein QNH15_17820 [Fictibacillus enclensis]SCC18343.1 hypothetical protein GA0061096_2907 [Fictibacillus enclensis]
MKKKIFALFSVFTLVFSFASIASAAGATAEMKAAIEKGLKDAHYDYKKGSIEISDVQTVPNEDKKLNTSEIVVGMGSYKTKRDNIFSFTHKEIVFYNPKDNKMLTEQEVAKAGPELQKYKKDHESETGTKMDYVVVLLLLALVLLVPLYLLTIWEKGQYLTTKFKIKNNLYNHTKEFN